MIRASLMVVLAAFPTIAAADSIQSMDTLTITATITTPSASTKTTTSKAETIKQSLTSVRIGNREILQLMADEEIIPSITGYSLVQKFTSDGTHIGYFARHTSGAEVKAPEEIFGFSTAGEITAFNQTTKQPTKPGGAVTVTSSSTSKVMKTVSLNGASCTLFDTVTKTTPTTGKIGTTSYTFTGVTSSGVLYAFLPGTPASGDTPATAGMTIEGTMKAATPKPLLPPN